METAAVLRAEGNPAPAWSREQVIARYRHLRAISKRHHSKALDFLTSDAVLHHARRLGSAVGRMFLVDDMDELVYAFDLAIHTASAERSRCIDRYARSARLPPGSDEALVLDAMCRARFSIVRIERRHEAAGLVARDIFREVEHWLVDEGLESSTCDKSVLATRLYTPDHFSMTAGVLVPVNVDLIVEALESAPHLMRKSHAQACDDRRFAESIYRIALADGLVERVAYQDLEDEAA